VLKAALAFIPLLSGYIFVSTWLRTSFQTKRDNTQKVYFRAAFWGMWLFLLSFGLATWQRELLHPVLAFFGTWREQVILTDGEPALVNLMFWLFCLGGTLLLGMIGGFALNWITALLVTPTGFYLEGEWLSAKHRHKPQQLLRAWYQYAKAYEIKKAIHDFNSEVEIMLLRALEHGMPVFVTTPTKVYVGYVMGSIEAESKRESLRILPVISGYRDSQTRKVIFTTSYLSVYQKFSQDPGLRHLNPSLFEIVIPADEIKTISLFDVKAYLAFQELEASDPDQLKLELLNPF
jgi:hypothetical protein